jgi:tRNA isopentenyl-2-thiomethyl-A-37 hydroxylase MiaE
MSELLVLDFKSCEMICDELAEKIIAKYPHRELIIDVSEDGENGAHCIYEGE